MGCSQVPAHLPTLLLPQVDQLDAIQAAVDDTNQRLFELRVEVQNATGDADAASAATQQQAQAAEQRAAEAVKAAAAASQLAGSLQAGLAATQEQLALLAERQAGVPDAAAVVVLVQQQLEAEAAGQKAELVGAAQVAAATTSLMQTVDEVASELAGLKLQLAQQREAAEGANAAARAETAVREGRLEAMEQRLEQLGTSPRGRAATNAAETATCLSTLTEIVHKQREELQQIKHVMAAVGEDAADVAGRQHALAGQHQVTAAALEAAVAGLQQQLDSASALGREQQAELAAVQAALETTPTCGQQGSGGAHDVLPALAAMQQRMAALEAAAAEQEAGSACRREAAEPAGAAAAVVDSSQLEVLWARMASLEAALAGSPAPSSAAAPGSTQSLPPGLQQEVDARVQRTEATVATALEELAAQMAALMSRMERAEEAAEASAAHAQEAAAVATQQVAAVQSLSVAPSRRSSQREAAVQHSNGGGGLFARLHRSFSSQHSAGSSISQEAPAGAAAAEQGQQGGDVPLRMQWSGTFDQPEASRESLGSEALGSPRPRSRHSTGNASGAGTPRGSGGKFTPRSRQGSSQRAATQQAEWGGVSGQNTPRGEPSAFSSFGDLPLPQGSSCLATPRSALLWGRAASGVLVWDVCPHVRGRVTQAALADHSVQTMPPLLRSSSAGRTLRSRRAGWRLCWRTPCWMMCSARCWRATCSACGRAWPGADHHR